MDSEGSVACTDLGITKNREGVGDEQAAQIAVPLFTDTGEPILAAKRSFLAPAGNAQILLSGNSLVAILRGKRGWETLRYCFRKIQ